MMPFLKTNRRGRPPRQQRTTAISFSAEGLDDLAQVMVAGKRCLRSGLKLPLGSRQP
jgi:hypothetical protein